MSGQAEMTPERARDETVRNPLPDQRVAVTVFVTVPAVDEHDAGIIAAYAVRDTLGDQQIVTVKDDSRVVRIAGVIETGIASRNGHLSVRPTSQVWSGRDWAASSSRVGFGSFPVYGEWPVLHPLVCGPAPQCHYWVESVRVVCGDLRWRRSRRPGRAVKHHR